MRPLPGAACAASAHGKTVVPKIKATGNNRSGLCKSNCRQGQRYQLRVWSTSLFLLIQGIMARSWPPTFSMAWSAFMRRRAVMLG